MNSVGQAPVIFNSPVSFLVRFFLTKKMNTNLFIQAEKVIYDSTRQDNPDDTSFGKMSKIKVTI